MITIKNFINEYNNAENELEYMNGHIKTTYVPIERKASICEAICQASMYVTDINGARYFHQNSVARNILFVANIIGEYTDILFNLDEMTKNYDLLEKEGLINVILSCLQSSELDKFNEILKLTVDDIKENERSFVGFMDGKVDALIDLLNHMDIPIDADQSAQ